jgi:[histone H3]-lysine9 N-trimethyltransferase SUV39H
LTSSGSKTLPPRSEAERGPKPVVEIDILKQFQAGPVKSRAERDAERKKLWAQLKESTKLATEDPDLVEQHFGQTGFSKAFRVEDDKELAFMRKAASKKKKRVNRADITLSIESIVRSVEDLNLDGKKLIHPSRTAQKILTSQFDKQQVNPPLKFTNTVNTKRLHGKFQFISQYIIGDKVRPAPPSTNKGCECTDCSLSSCLCFEKKVVQDKLTSYDLQLETYTRRDGIVVLSESFLARELEPTTTKYEVTECNELCRCGPSCWNRNVGNGRTVPLEIFQTEKCGFGVRSSQDILRGQFIELYLGEILTTAELCRREAAVSEDDPSYIYSLDWLKPKDPDYHVDGKYFGSAMRFVNHSCSPNARCFPVQFHKKDDKVYHLAFFAIRDIKAGVEIRIDYRSEGVDQDDEEVGQDGQLPNGLTKCYCGEKNCRGILWTPGVKARRRRRLKE